MLRKIITNQYFPVVVIIILALFLRSVNLPWRFPFSGEIGDNLLEIRNYISNKSIPLKGPPTSHEWLSFGPFYYWIMIPFLILFKFNPLFSAYLGALLGSIIVIVNYIVINNIFGKRIALISSLIISISPLFLSFSLDSRFYYFAVLFYYPLLYFLNRFWKGNVKSLFLVGVSFGLMLNFHYSSLLLFPSVILVIYLKRKYLKFKNYLLCFLGFLLVNVSLLIYDFNSGFVMLRNFLLWIPYRLLGFFGLMQRNTANLSSISGSLFAFIQAIGKTITLDNNCWLFIALFITGYVFYKVKKKDFKINKFPWVFLISSIIFSLIGIIIHGNVPLHYLIPIFPITTIIISFSFSDLVKGKKVYAAILLIIFLLSNKYYKEILFNKDDYVSLKPLFVSFGIQKKITLAIINDAKGQKFVLGRVGPYDYFKENYAQNYIYLLWFFGNEPIKNAGLKYTIYEDTTSLPENAKNKIIWVDSIAILKS